MTPLWILEQVFTLDIGYKWKVVDLETPSNALRFVFFQPTQIPNVLQHLSYSEKVAFNILEKFPSGWIKESWFTVKDFFMLGYYSANAGFIAASLIFLKMNQNKNLPDNKTLPLLLSILLEPCMVCVFRLLMFLKIVFIIKNFFEIYFFGMYFWIVYLQTLPRCCFVVSHITINTIFLTSQ